MKAFVRVTILPAALEDVAPLDPDIKRAIVEALVRLEANLEEGAPLGFRDSTGDLRGCRKIYVDKPSPDKPRFRLVYWLAPDERSPRRARVLCVGPRAALGAYDIAVSRYNDDRASTGLPPVESLSDEQLGLSTD